MGLKSAISRHVAALSGTIPSQPTAATVHPLPAAEPGYRLVPALVGRAGAAQIVHVQCPTSWCVVDHAAERVAGVEDVNHRGERRGMSFAPSGGDRVPVEVYLSQWPGSDEDDSRPHLAVDLDCEVATYGRTAALAMADQLVAFAEDVRRLAMTLPGDSDPDMDEALRRARGGAS